MIINNIHLDTLINALQILRDEGYEYLDLEITDKVSDRTKYHSLLSISGNDKKKEEINSNKPNRKLTIDELLEYES